MDESPAPSTATYRGTVAHVSGSEHQTLPLVDLIGSVEAEGALFTTFTLSLAWFEVYLLREMERRGVRRVAILADPMGIQQSLREGLATGPGLRYALEPVSMPAGVFHPKLALVWGHGRVMLAVGSGNLTLPGMQRNLEVWDVLLGGYTGTPVHRQLSREVARRALAFLAELGSRLDSGAWSQRALRDGSAALRGVMPSLVEDNGVLWLDSFTGTIGEQLVARAGPPSGSRGLRFLSPFHHPTGEPIRRLAAELGADRAELLFTDGASTFPVDAALAWEGVHLTTHELSVRDRPLHAKVFQVVDPQHSLLLYGSANATDQALWSQRNVEVCLLRDGDAASFVGLLDSQPAVPRKEESELRLNPKAALWIDWARASEEGVRVKLSCGRDTPTSVALRYVDGEDDARSYSWPSAAIELPFPQGFDPMRPRPTRVEACVIEAGDRVVTRAWVAFEGWLEASPRWRRAVAAWSRLLQGEMAGADEEDAELLGIFGEEHSRTMGLLGRRRATPATSTGKKGRASEVPVPVELLEAAARGYRDKGLDGALMDDRATHVTATTQAMLQAFRTLDRVEDAYRGEGGSGRGAVDGGRPAGLAPSVRDALDRFEERFVTACRTLTERPHHPEEILAYAGLCLRLSMRYRLLDGDGHQGLWAAMSRFLLALVGQRAEGPPVLSLLKGADGSPEVLGQLSAVISLLHWHQGGGRLEGEHESKVVHAAGPALRECLATLERFTGHRQVGPQLPRALRPVFPGEPGELEESILGLRRLDAPSDHAAWLRWAVYRLSKGEEDLRGLARLLRERASRVSLEAEERAMLTAVQHRIYPSFVQPWIDQCPACNMGLAYVARQRLRGRRVVQCSHCRRWLLPSEAI